MAIIKLNSIDDITPNLLDREEVSKLTGELVSRLSYVTAGQRRIAKFCDFYVLQIYTRCETYYDRDQVLHFAEENRKRSLRLKKNFLTFTQLSKIYRASYKEIRFVYTFLGGIKHHLPRDIQKLLVIHPRQPHPVVEESSAKKLLNIMGYFKRGKKIIEVENEDY